MNWDLSHIRAARERVLAAGDAPFSELVRIAGLDPTNDFRLADLSDVDFKDSDLTGYDFSGARLVGCNFRRAILGNSRFDKAELGLAPAAVAGAIIPAVEFPAENYWDAHLNNWRPHERPTSDVYLPTHAIFRDAPFTPELLVVPAGKFVMGVADDDPRGSERERPQHEVTLAYRFAVGRFCVSVAEYARFCDATDRASPSKLSTWGNARWGEGTWSAPHGPITHVSCDDAEAYCDWLSTITKETYRLPSEAEWEYACRAGSERPYWWGVQIQQAEDGAQHTESRERSEHLLFSSRTGEGQIQGPNNWGLVGMFGDNWEWCLDEFYASYEGAPSDGSARTVKNPRLAVNRGGGFQSLRDEQFSDRVFRQRIVHSKDCGFRVVREMSA